MTASIKLIVTDLDGTLLNSQHALSERNLQAINAARAQGIQVVLATGKTRGSALSVLEKLNLDTPGIFVQGLVTHAADGSIRQQLTLDPAVARQVITFAEDRGFALMAYSGTRLLVRQRNHDTDLFLEYGEPEPEIVGPLQNILDTTPINKIAAVHRADPRRITALRWQLNMQLNGTARLMQAGVAATVEILPKNGSKATALKALFKELKIAPAQVLAIGDGENDIEMLQTAGIGVAVKNAHANVQGAADHVVASNDEDGVAEAIERFALTKETDAAADKSAPKPEDITPSVNNEVKPA
jgi:Cof subfamily protein (haloacid dehalogenase superfamily)